jgi:hypothetical protein
LPQAKFVHGGGGAYMAADVTSKEAHFSNAERVCAAEDSMDDEVSNVDGPEEDLDEEREEDELNEELDTTPTYPCPEWDGSVFVFSSEMTERSKRIAKERKRARQLVVPPYIAAKLFRSSWLAGISALVAYSQGKYQHTIPV